MCVSLHFRACQMQSSANDVPSHTLQHLSSLKGLVGSCPNMESSKMWKRRNVDRGAPRHSLVNSASMRACLQMTRVCLAAGCSWIHQDLSSVASERESSWPVRVVVVRSLEFSWRRCSLVVWPNVLPLGFVGEQRCKRWQ